MLKKEDVVFEFYQGEKVTELDAANLEFKIYLKNVDDTKVYEVEIFTAIDAAISLDKVVDVHSIVTKIQMRNKSTQGVIKEIIVEDYPSYAIIANDLSTIKQSLCFPAKNII